MVGTLTRLDEIGQQPEELTSGSHPTYHNASMPLFFKATTLEQEETLGTTKERAMHSLASLLFGRGVADTAVVTVARHTTVNTRESKRDHPLLKWEIFSPDPVKFQNPATFDDNRAEYDVVKQQQRSCVSLFCVVGLFAAPWARPLCGNLVVCDCNFEAAFAALSP